MRPLLPLLLVLLVGCPPPPAVDLGDTGAGGEPSIKVIYPPQGAVLDLEDDCTLSIVVVTRVDNLELIDPAEAGGAVEGQGHWHLEIGNTYESAFEEYLVVERMDVPADQTQIFGIALHNNLHQPVQGAGSQTNLEIRTASPQGVTCP